MTSNFIPMLSSSPPPLDDDAGSVDEEDDEFHDYLSASKVLDSPVDSPIQTPESTPSKTVQLKEQLQDIKKKPEESTLQVEECGFSDFQMVSSHNETDSSDFNSSKEFSEFYTCSSKTTEDDLDFKIPVLDDTDSFFKADFDSVVEASETETLTCDSNGQSTQLRLRKNSIDAFQNIPNEPAGLNHDDSDDEDEFADFESAAFNKDKETQDLNFIREEIEFIRDEKEEKQNSLIKEKDESFADFATASFEPQNENFESEENEWADFNTSTSLENTAKFASHEELAHGTSSHAFQNFMLAFPAPTEDNYPAQVDILPKLSVSLQSSIGGIWTKLEDLDQSLSLRHQWIGSEAFQKTLQSLNIDSRNILRNPTIPLFACLGHLLEPVKVDPGFLEESEINNKPSSPKFEKQENLIPPAQFDWNSSGLVNPLDPTQVSSSLLDLDFFNQEYASTSKSVAKTFSLEEELLGQDSTLDANNIAPNHPSSQQNILLEQLMTNIKLTNSTLPPNRKRSENLSEGTVKILKRIPHLSFMKAKVLMFPIHSDEVS